jgi:hypothetical protein
VGRIEKPHAWLVQNRAGEAYSPWAYVPQGVSVSQARATTNEGREISVHHELLGNSLKVSMQGKRGVVAWEIKFKP